MPYTVLDLIKDRIIELEYEVHRIEMLGWPMRFQKLIRDTLKLNKQIKEMIDGESKRKNRH